MITFVTVNRKVEQIEKLAAEKKEKPDLIIDKAKYFHPEAGVVLAKTAINLIEEITTLRARIAKLEKKQ